MEGWGVQRSHVGILVLSSTNPGSRQTEAACCRRQQRLHAWDTNGKDSLELSRAASQDFADCYQIVNDGSQA